MSSKWLSEEEHLLKLLRPTNSYDEIANEFKKRHETRLPGFSTERSADAIRRKCERDNITPESCSTYMEDNLYSDRWDYIRSIQEQYKSLSEARHRGILDPDTITRKILSLSDIHFPLAREDLLNNVINEHCDADVVVINGDLMEGYIFSTFEKSRTIAALHEYNISFEFVQVLSEIFPKVILIDGNHDVRISKAIKRAGFEREASQIFRPNLMARIANGERLDASGMLVEKLDFSNVFYEPRESHYARIGKTIFIHPFSKGSNQVGFTARRCYEYLRNRYDENEFDSVVAGHCHKIYKGIVDSRLLIEQGCFADLLNYSHDPRLEWMSNAMNGYAVIYQDNEGNTDYNMSGPIFLGEVLPPKKSVI